VPLDLRDSSLASAVNGQQYALWTEVRTDQTAPARKYANATIQLVSTFPAAFTAGAPPVIPLLRNASGQDDASIIAAPLSPPNNRQIVDLGAVDVGDRLFISLLSVPGYMESYTQTGFSVLLLDGQQELYAWYQDGLVLFSAESKFVIGHPSPSFYIVLDALGTAMMPSVRVRIQRGAFADAQPRQQTVFLDFRGTTPGSITVADTPKFVLQPFSVDPPTDAVLMTAIVSRVETLLAPYNFQVLSSSRGDSPPAGPHDTVYFDTTGVLLAAAQDRNGDFVVDPNDLEFWGLSNFIDPRNETLSGRAVVAVNELIAAFFPNDLATGPRGTAIGNVVVHHIGLMSGLRDTTGVSTDVMTNDMSLANSSLLNFTIAPLLPLSGHDQIGQQNAPVMLDELFHR